MLFYLSRKISSRQNHFYIIIAPTTLFSNNTTHISQHNEILFSISDKGHPNSIGCGHYEPYNPGFSCGYWNRHVLRLCVPSSKINRIWNLGVLNCRKLSIKTKLDLHRKHLKLKPVSFKIVQTFKRKHSI